MIFVLRYVSRVVFKGSILGDARQSVLFDNLLDSPYRAAFFKIKQKFSNSSRPLAKPTLLHTVL